MSRSVKTLSGSVPNSVSIVYSVPAYEVNWNTSTSDTTSRLPGVDEGTATGVEVAQSFPWSSPLPSSSNTRTESLPLASPEDTVAHKLYWYEQGQRVSERQWKDVLGVLKTRRDSLDERALRRAANSLGVAPGLVDTAFTAAGWPVGSDQD